MTRKMRWIFVGAGIFAFLAMGFSVYYFVIRVNAFREYDTVTIARGDFSKEIREDGIFEPTIKVEVGSQIAGKVSEIFVDYDDPVKKDQELARIESDLSRKKLERVEAKLKSANADIVKKQTDIEIAHGKIKTTSRHLEQNRLLAKDGVIAMEDLWQAEDDYENALKGLEKEIAELNSLKLQIEEAQLDIELAKIEFENSFIRAPIDGVVLSKNIEIGQTVSGASFQVYPLFEICSPIEHLKFVAPISYVDVSSVRIGQEIIIKVNTTTGVEKFISRVREIRTNPTISGNIVTYDVIAVIDNVDKKLKPGIKGTCSIIFYRQKDVLIISQTALNKALAFSGKENQIAVLRNNKVYYCQIRIGMQNDAYVEIYGADLRDGDLAVIGLREENSENSDAKTSPLQMKFRK